MYLHVSIMRAFYLAYAYTDRTMITTNIKQTSVYSNCQLVNDDKPKQQQKSQQRHITIVKFEYNRPMYQAYTCRFWLSSMSSLLSPSETCHLSHLFRAFALHIHLHSPHR